MLKGTVGWEDTIQLGYYAGDGALTFLPNASPATPNKTLQFKANDGTLLSYVQSDGTAVFTNLIVNGVASIGNLAGSTGVTLPSLVVGPGAASFSSVAVASGLLTNTLIVTGGASVGSLSVGSQATLGGRIVASSVGASPHRLLNYVPFRGITQTTGSVQGQSTTGSCALVGCPSQATAVTLSFAVANGAAGPLSLSVLGLDGNAMHGVSSASNADVNLRTLALFATIPVSMANLNFQATVGNSAAPCLVNVLLTGYFEPA